MPTYVYKFVETGETIEVQQSFTDDTLTEVAHPETGEVMAVKKVFQPVGVTFRGSGFFKTDNRGKAAASETSSKNGAAGTSTPSGDTSSGGTSKDSAATGSKKSSSDSGSTKPSSPPASTSD